MSEKLTVDVVYDTGSFAMYGKVRVFRASESTGEPDLIEFLSLSEATTLAESLTNAVAEATLEYRRSVKLMSPCGRSLTCGRG